MVMNLQDTCAYYAEFSKEKLFWMHMSKGGRFAYSNEEIFCNNKAFIMLGQSLKYHCAVLNSYLLTWWIDNIAVTTGVGLTQWDKFTVERIPIPEIPVTEQLPFHRLVDSILTVKIANPSANTRELESELDDLVYQLYDLTPEDIATIKA